MRALYVDLSLNEDEAIAMKAFWFGAGLSTFLLAVSATGSEVKTAAPDAARGKELAARLCINCHTVPGMQAPTAQLNAAPSFDDIATRKGQTVENIKAALLQPTHQMPQVALTRREIDDLIAFIDSRRRELDGTSIVPKNKTRPKPVYPQPS